MMETIQAKLQRMFDVHFDKNAIEYGEQRITYKELGERSELIANWLISNANYQDHIGILIDDKIELIVYTLGVLKAGCVVVPLDSNYPDERLKVLITTSETRVVFVDGVNHSRLDMVSDRTTIINKEGLHLEHLDDSVSRQEIMVTGEDKVYITFTSGTTGNPKAIVGKNKSLLHFIEWEIEELKLDHGVRVSQFTSQCHDPFFRDVFVPLCVGGTICIPLEKLSGSIAGWIESNNIHVVHCVPSFFKIINVQRTSDMRFEHLKYILLAGEKVNSRDLADWIKDFNNQVQIINLYGPSETTLAKFFYLVSPEDLNKSGIPIGKPIRGAKAVVVDEQFNICDIGKSGEIIIRTPYLTHGYLNHPQENNRRFIVNPLTNRSDDIVYRTGDLGRVLPDGNFEFLGRMDNQVKIRGFRVELDEIQYHLLEYPKVKEAIVRKKETPSGDSYLCAYIVVEDSEYFDTTELKQEISSRLPDFMIPKFFMLIPDIPYNLNGKVDYNKLPEPHYIIDKEYTQPKTLTEQRMKEIICEILYLEDVSTDSELLDLGINSLQQLELIAIIYHEFSVEIPLTMIYEYATISSLSVYIDKEKNISSSSFNINKRDFYPLSAAQSRLFVLNQLESSHTGYNITKVLLIEGAINRQKMEFVFQQIVDRHNILKSFFTIVDNEPVVKIDENYQFKINWIKAEKVDLSSLVQEYTKPFDLSQPSLMRVTIFQLSEFRYALHIDMHHIISDISSLNILIHEFMSFYEGLEIPALPYQYSDFAIRQKEIYESDKFKTQERYWIEVFQGDLPVLDMPTDFIRPVVQEFEGASVRVSIDNELEKRLKQLASDQGVSLNMVMFSAFVILLAKYTNQEDIIIGTPISGRNTVEMKDVVGMFVNTLAIRSYPQAQKTYTDFLQEIKGSLLTAYDNQDYPFEELLDHLKIKRDISRNPLFDVMFAYQNIQPVELKLRDLEVTAYEWDTMNSKFDLSLHVVENTNGIDLFVEYATHLFTRDTIDRLSGHYIQILKGISSLRELKIAQITMVTDQEMMQLTSDFNSTSVPVIKNKSVHHLFEEKALKKPDMIALKYRDQEITYGELSRGSNQLASILLHHGIGPEKIVSVMLERTPLMVQCILAIWKADGVYLPLNPSAPSQRNLTILEQSDTKVLLTDNKYLDQLISQNFQGEIITMDKLDYESEQGASLNLLSRSYSDSSLAYVIYTSGTTGLPKGAMIEHDGMMNHIEAKINDLGMCSESIVAQNASHTFDISIWQFFAALIVGGTTVIYDDDLVQDVVGFVKQVQEDQVTILEVVPSFLTLVLEVVENSNTLGQLKHLMVTGEVLKVALVNRWFEIYPDIPLVNAFGPTEASDDITHHLMYGPQTSDRVPLGKPIQNTKIYILDENGCICPVGVKGEIAVTGIGVGRGYLNDVHNTKKSFIKDPFSTDYKQRMYKTGDIGCWLPDGTISYFGRKDHQVKLNGYRIELEEISNQLIKNPKIREAVVTKNEYSNGTPYLCAYIATDTGLDIEEVKSFLHLYLPEYMIPNHFVSLDKLPLTTNGKIDRSMLKAPVTEQLFNGVRPPVTSTELRLAEIWSSLLDIKDTDIDMSFFELGGNSLKAMSLIFRINKEFNTSIVLKDIFTNQTIYKQSKLIDQSKKNSLAAIERVAEREYYELSPVQRRIYILQQMEGIGTAYNMPNVFYLKGRLDYEKLQRAFQKIISRHDILRTSFIRVGDSLVQKIEHVEDVPFHLPIIQRSQASLETQCKELIQSFDLSCSPLFRASLIQIKPSEHVLFFDIHHIISDGISNEILTREILTAYRGDSLPKLDIQYKDYANWQNTLLDSPEGRKQEEYWLRQLDSIAEFEIPLDYPRPLIRRYEGNEIIYTLDTRLSEGLKQIAHDEEATLFMVLLALYKILMSKYSSSEDIIIGTPVSGRTHNNIENALGMFVNTIPLRSYPKEELEFSAYLKQLKDTTIQAFENQSYPFEQLLRKLNLQRDVRRNPLYDIVFVLQNMEKSDLVMDELHVSELQIGHSVSKFDLTLDVKEKNGQLELRFEYSTAIFKEETIQRMAKSYINLCHEAIKTPQKLIKDMDMITNEDKQALLNQFSNQGFEYPDHVTIHGLFENQVKANPNHIAIDDGVRTYTYKELNEKANRIAQAIIQSEISTGSVVALVLERSGDMIATILGVLKANTAYMPIDPDYPDERVKYMLQDSKASLVITQSQYKDKIQHIFQGDILTLNEEFEKEFCELAEVPIIRKANSQDLAYVIYTSGTSGNPKGVMVEHRNVTSLMANTSSLFEFTNEDVWTMFHSYCFDFSVWEMYGALLFGGKLVIISKKTALDPRRFLEILVNQKVTVLNQTPTYFYRLLEEVLRRNENDLNLNTIIFGGEALQPSMLLKWRESYPDTKLVNMYGITETTVHVTFREITEMDIEKNTKQIGSPIPSLNLYVMDQNRKLVAPGIVGELHISGGGVSRGYINAPNLTREKFIENPYHPGRAMYKTGDKVKWNTDGTLEYYGRMDEQVKVRGFRIELNEVQEKILLYNGVKNAVVMVKKDQSDYDYICVYFTAQFKIEPKMLRQYLSISLPDYMLPSVYYQLESIPLNSNGKVDKKALLAYEHQDLNEGALQNDSLTDIENTLLKIWSEILPNAVLDIHDNFFDLGGDSILIIQLHSKIENVFPDCVSVTDLFAYPSIHAIAKKMSDSRGDEIQIPQMEFPNSFFDDNIIEKQDSTIYKFAIEDEFYSVMKKINKDQQFTVRDILLSSYLYLLSETVEQESVHIQTLKRSANFTLSINMNGINDMEHLLTHTHQSIHELQNNKIQNDVYQKGKQSVASFVYIEQDALRKTFSLAPYDIVVVASETSHSMEITFEFRNNRFKKAKRIEFVQTFNKIIKSTINSMKRIKI